MYLKRHRPSGVSSFSKGLRIRGLTVLVFTAKQQFFFDTSSSFLEGFVGVNSHYHHWQPFRMNLRTNPTRSQRNAHWDILVEAVVGAAVALKASKKSKRRGGTHTRTAS